MIDKQRLEAKCSTWNITLTGTQLDQLDAFAEILVDYNQKVNLTAITDPIQKTVLEDTQCHVIMLHLLIQKYRNSNLSSKRVERAIV